MTTETTGRAVIVVPGSGEVIDLAGTTTDLADAITTIDALTMRLGEARQAVVDEVAQRLDFEGQRKTILDAGDAIYELETNAPAAEVYPVDRLASILDELVDAGVISRAVADRVIAKPQPKPVEAKVYTRELNKLLANPDIARRVAAARVRRANTRTLKINRKATSA